MSEHLEDRVMGLLLGSFIGDAVGGPVEFQDPEDVQALENPPKRWQPGEKLDANAITAASQRLVLRPYAPLRMAPEPYAHWTANAPAGTFTDDSRLKLILLAALRRDAESGRRQLDAEMFAREILDWRDSPAVAGNSAYQEICDEWLAEWQYASRWVLGDRNPASARPPVRLWGGVPTCAGQMISPPLAALFPGKPLDAYLASHKIGYFDNGFARDLNASIVAGLACALTAEVGTARSARREAWARVLGTMRSVDPFGYAQVPWVTRSTDRYLDLAEQLVQEANGEPARLFAGFDREFEQAIKWEAQVPFVVAFSCIAMCEQDPLASMQLSIEWGHDTDSYAQLAGALVGALYGASIFPDGIGATVLDRVKTDYAADLSVEGNWLAHRSHQAVGPSDLI